MMKLGTFAIGDQPASHSPGVYRVPGRGWYASAHGHTAGPFETDEEAHLGLASIETGESVWDYLRRDTAVAIIVLLAVVMLGVGLYGLAR